MIDFKVIPLLKDSYESLQKDQGLLRNLVTGPNEDHIDRVLDLIGDDEVLANLALARIIGRNDYSNGIIGFVDSYESRKSDKLDFLYKVSKKQTTKQQILLLDSFMDFYPNRVKSILPDSSSEEVDFAMYRIDEDAYAFVVPQNTKTSYIVKEAPYRIIGDLLPLEGIDKIAKVLPSFFTMFMY